ncbi:MAG TPA: chain length determinant protein tyrosine kinase EpsG [Caldimonas sp.]|nr:chain length determinant protein tyrosine kinase EpsG [Caldimonas sp.]
MKMTVSMIGGAPRATRSLGGILVDSGLLKPEDAERVLQLQKEENLRFGAAAVKLGLLTEADIQYALARQFSYAYLRRGPGEKRQVSDEIVAAYQPFSPRVEQLRAIRSQLMLRWFDKAELRQVLTVIGTERGEGRSYLAANLAVVFSQLGERTLLVDADLRSPRQHELFYLENKIGLSTVLSGRSREEAIVRIADLAGLSVLPAGPVPPNPLELLNRLNFDEFLMQVKANYDIIILDTPALAEGEDGAMLAVRTGAALAVARAGRTRMSDFQDMVQGLMSAGVAIVGTVLNEAQAKAKKKRWNGTQVR